jgi:hypothetical protein
VGRPRPGNLGICFPGNFGVCFGVTGGLCRSARSGAQARPAVQAGGGRYPEGPSPPTNRAAARFLERRARLPPDAVEAAAVRGVGSTLRALTALQVRSTAYADTDPVDE